ncbi:MAG: TonB-dependent receptor plug domain-containing protein, partial [Sphingomonadales bacterium]
MKSLYLMVIGVFFTPILSFAQLTFEVRDAYTFESVNGLTIQSKAKVKQLSNSSYQLEGQAPFTVEIVHPDYEKYTLQIPGTGVAVQATVYLVPNTQTENETVVSANKTAEKRKDVAQKIQVIRASELQFQQQTSMADVLANSGSVFVQKSQLGGGSPIIRGFETNKVLLVVDGIRMNNAIYRGGHLQNCLTLD